MIRLLLIITDVINDSQLKNNEKAKIGHYGMRMRVLFMVTNFRSNDFVDPFNLKTKILTCFYCDGE